MRNNYIIILLFGVLLSCQEDSNSDYVESPNKENLSLSEIKSLLITDKTEIDQDGSILLIEKFQELNDDLKTKGERSIINEKRKYILPVSKKNEIQMRSSEIANEVAFREFDVNNGMKGKYTALVCSDKRFPSVVAFLENQEIIEYEYEKEDNLMLALSELSAISRVYEFEKNKDSLKMSAKTKIAKSLNIALEDVDESTILKYLNMPPKTKDGAIDDWEWYLDFQHLESFSSPSTARTKTQWNQTAPYNRKFDQSCPASNATEYAGYEGRKKVGCAVVTIAQLIAHYGPPLICSGQRMDWTTLKSTSQIKTNSSPTLINMVSAFMKWTADKTGANFSSCEGTDLDTNNGLSKIMPLLNITYDAKTDFKPSTFYKIKKSLQDGRLTILRGESDRGGHAWIIDKYVEIMPGGEQYPDIRDTYLRCNMGWSGSNDGYYFIDIDPNSSIDFNCSMNGVYDRKFMFWANFRFK